MPAEFPTRIVGTSLHPFLRGCPSPPPGRIGGLQAGNCKQINLNGFDLQDTAGDRSDYTRSMTYFQVIFNKDRTVGAHRLQMIVQHRRYALADPPVVSIGPPSCSMGSHTASEASCAFLRRRKTPASWPPGGVMGARCLGWAPEIGMVQKRGQAPRRNPFSGS